MMLSAVALVETIAALMGVLAGACLLFMNNSDDAAMVAPAGLTVLVAAATIIVSCEIYFKFNPIGG